MCWSWCLDSAGMWNGDGNFEQNIESRWRNENFVVDFNGILNFWFVPKLQKSVRTWPFPSTVFLSPSPFSSSPSIHRNQTRWLRNISSKNTKPTSLPSRFLLKCFSFFNDYHSLDIHQRSEYVFNLDQGEQLIMTSKWEPISGHSCCIQLIERNVNFSFSLRLDIQLWIHFWFLAYNFIIIRRLNEDRRLGRGAFNHIQNFIVILCRISMYMSKRTGYAFVFHSRKMWMIEEEVLIDT